MKMITHFLFMSKIKMNKKENLEFLTWMYSQSIKLQEMIAT